VEASLAAAPIALDFARGLARDLGACVVAGIVQEIGGGPRNTATVIDDAGNTLACYVKQRPFSAAGEDACYAAGSETVVFPWGGFQVAPFICYDLRFPELFRRAAAQGATLFVVPACWPIKRDRHWMTLLQARAIENQAFAAGCNRCGREPQFTYSGRSLAVDPQGVIIADASSAERLISVEITPEEVAGWRAEFPALRDAGLHPGL
jgi:omega-amidase